MKYMLKTERNASGNVVFKKMKGEGRNYVYYAMDESGASAPVTREWVNAHMNDIVNLGYSGDKIYPVQNSKNSGSKGNGSKKGKTLTQLIDFMKNKQDMNVSAYDDNSLEISFYSDMGEEFVFCVSGNSVADLVKDIGNYASNFDTDEHVQMWAEAKANGAQGVPTYRELVDDADMIAETLDNLAMACSKFIAN